MILCYSYVIKTRYNNEARYNETYTCTCTINQTKYDIDTNAVYSPPPPTGQKN